MCNFITKFMTLFGLQTAVGIRNILFSTPIQTGPEPNQPTLYCVLGKAAGI